MIRLNDAITLAYTKLRTRRIRTTVTVVIASLLFGVIAVATIVLQGGLDSVNTFTDGSLSGRYLTMASMGTHVDYTDQSLPGSIRIRANEIYNQTITDKKAAAKKLGIAYDPATEEKPYAKYIDNEDMLNYQSPAAMAAVNEYAATLPTAKQLLAKNTATFKPVKTYEMTNSGNVYGLMKPITKGAEDFAKQPGYPNNNDAADISFGWQYLDQSVTQPFMLSAAQLSTQKNTTDIPVIAPISKVEEALGLKKLDNKATAAEKLARLRFIRDNAQTATFTACYRNGVSQMQIDSAITVAKEITKNKGNKDYQKPSLIYGLPAADGCLPATVLSDIRTSDEKKMTAKQTEFAGMFGQDTEPTQQKITFRAVGLAPGGVNSGSFSAVEGLVSAVIGTTLNNMWVVPQQLFDVMPNKQDFAQFIPDSTTTPSASGRGDSQSIIIAEFGSAADAKAFVSKVGCGAQYCENNVSAMYFGSNSVLIEDIRSQATQALWVAALVVAVIASIIMMGMTGRVIGDSRRETAVFRAIGAKRNDIRLIYLVYTTMLSLIIVTTSLVLGTIAAVWINGQISPDATVQAHLTYMFTNDNLTFSFIGFWWQAVAALVGLILLAGFVGMLLPLARNLARSPIKDMRDDT